MATVVRYREELRADFERLNRRWIETYFVVEEPDLEAFRNPGETILAPGGEIFFVVDGDRVVGTCAMIPHGPGEYELAKMAVDPTAQGRGFGDLLMDAALGFAAQAGARRVILLSNTRLTPALRLYRKHGFREVPLDPDQEYVRADIKMVRELPAETAAKESGGR